MKHANILPESEWKFNWERAKKAADHVKREDGSVNWKAAMGADPGATKCPGCGEFYWAEAEKLECTECGTKWNINTKEEL